MNSFLNATVQLQAYNDRAATSNPRLRPIDWRRDISGLAIANPTTVEVEILPGESKVIFSGTRATTLDGTSSFDLSSSVTGRYRCSWVGGTDPHLRTGRGLSLSGVTVTVVANPNGSASFAVPGPAAFTGVVAGDIVFVPNISTGDVASPFSLANSGWWTVLAVLSPQNLILARMPGEAFEAASEVVVLTSATQLRAFSAAGVRVGDMMAISAGFAVATRRKFEVVAVTDIFVEFLSSSPLPLETSVEPGVSGLVFYSNAKKFLYVEADQVCALQMNGSTDLSDELEPSVPGSVPGFLVKTGPVWALTVVNLASAPLNVLVFGAE